MVEDNRVVPFGSDLVIRHLGDAYDPPRVVRPQDQQRAVVPHSDELVIVVPVDEPQVHQPVQKRCRNPDEVPRRKPTQPAQDVFLTPGNRDLLAPSFWAHVLGRYDADCRAWGGRRQDTALPPMIRKPPPDPLLERHPRRNPTREDPLTGGHPPHLPRQLPFSHAARSEIHTPPTEPSAYVASSHRVTNGSPSNGSVA